MASVGLIFGSDTQYRTYCQKMIQKELGKTLVDVHDIAKKQQRRYC